MGKEPSYIGIYWCTLTILLFTGVCRAKVVDVEQKVADHETSEADLKDALSLWWIVLLCVPVITFSCLVLARAPNGVVEWALRPLCCDCCHSCCKA
ncbi:uncharacterized protein [Ptychodera flava]|uniref:uncharacterized protein isoform X2 n=1 Tax=Ptychodera flava TaxID=63121 RepID=UPI00396A173C